MPEHSQHMGRGPGLGAGYGPEHRLEGLYRSHFAFFYSFARGFVEDQFVAEDITTEAFLTLWKGLHNIDTDEAAFAYLRVVVRNACLNHLRNRKREEGKSKDLYYLLEKDDDASRAAQDLRAEILSIIMSDVARLSPKMREMFDLAFIQGMSNEEISMHLGITHQSVRNEKYRLIKALKTRFSERGIPLIGLVWVLGLGHP